MSKMLLESHGVHVGRYTGPGGAPMVQLETTGQSQMNPQEAHQLLREALGALEREWPELDPAAFRGTFTV